MMRAFLSGPPKRHPVIPVAAVRVASTPATETITVHTLDECQPTLIIFTGYVSDISDNEPQIEVLGNTNALTSIEARFADAPEHPYGAQAFARIFLLFALFPCLWQFLLVNTTTS